jgi:exodeoxyribonuclease III
MKIYSWNVNGLRAVLRKGNFQRFLAEHKPDILCLQETKASRDQVEFDHPDYEEYWNSAEKKGYSGTAVFTKHIPEAVFYGFPPDIEKQYNLKDGYGDAATEGRVTTLEFEAFYAVSVYTPNAKDNLERLTLRKTWDQAFLAYMKRLQVNKPVIFGGDLNVAHTEDDLSRPKENIGKKGFTAEERSGLRAYVEAGFVDTFRLFTNGNGHYTWWSHFGNARARNVGWRIDYFLVSDDLRPIVNSARIHPDVMGSDHCPVSIEIAYNFE